jgi:hypothetical protein
MAKVKNHIRKDSIVIGGAPFVSVVSNRFREDGKAASDESLRSECFFLEPFLGQNAYLQLYPPEKEENLSLIAERIHAHEVLHQPYPN